MRAALENTPKGDSPTLEQITEKMGGFSSESDGTGDNTGPARRKTRRRG